LQAVIEQSEGDPAPIIQALGEIARARGMMQLALEVGITPENR
ncbi:MAG TPA: transcriptional regulator, partial [Deltaproteobacteria bacterium]|nr:transcriptional regulator [Deltaproteobacteria bacterium]